MKVLLKCILLSLILGACSLSSEQEKKLNLAVTSYLHSRNECQVLTYVAFTYPELVSSIKSQGDSVFQKRFNCELDSMLIDDPTLRQIVKKDNDIHVLYDLTAFNESTMLQEEKKFKLVALSNDNGQSWFFLDWNDYVDKSLLPKLKRLIKK